jgi:hypothetical protein
MIVITPAVLAIVSDSSPVPVPCSSPEDRDSGDSTATSIYAGDSPGPALTNFLLRWDLTADLYNMQHQILNIQGKRTMPVFVTENPRAYRSFINRSLTVLLE